MLEVRAEGEEGVAFVRRLDTLTHDDHLHVLRAGLQQGPDQPLQAWLSRPRINPSQVSNSLETVSSSSGGGVQLAVCTRPATAEESPVRGTQPYGLVSHLQQTHSSVTRGDYPRPSTGESRKGAFRFFSTWRATVGQPKEGLQKPRRSAPEADPSRGGYG